MPTSFRHSVSAGGALDLPATELSLGSSGLVLLLICLFARPHSPRAPQALARPIERVCQIGMNALWMR
jgi:hypothetical protein